MVRLSSDLTCAWNSLSRPSAINEVGWQYIPVESGREYRLRAGRHFPGNEQALLFGFRDIVVPIGEALPSGKGFTVELLALQNDGMNWLALTCSTIGNSELFLTMVCDVVASLDAIALSDERKLVRMLLVRVRAWQEFMRKDVHTLSHEAEIGLIGELILLKRILKNGVPNEAAIDAWVGPLNALHDFKFGNGAIEVKTTLTSVNFPAKIISLEQLDNSEKNPLFIAGVRLGEAPYGNRLPDFIELIMDFLTFSTEVKLIFESKLIAGGYLYRYSDQYLRRFEVLNMRLIKIDELFPKLTKSTVPFGVTSAIYEIDIDKIFTCDCEINDALKLFGAI